MINDKSPEYWFQLAQHDKETTDLLIKKNGYPDIIIYHLHQAIEKILKGLILKENMNFPYIHDLERLYKILSAKNTEYKGLEEFIIILQSFYKDLRYPQSEFLTEEDLIEAKKAFYQIFQVLFKAA
ncbi:HEPN domain-containing protein [Candidatus Margulisiibacteriota bacterium]